ncbi:MAG: UDP-3-O-(3-hydroxymyristoyl)glucosamine N-acyltransferase [Acidobacteria bacterium]|nr:UDP-3-O-(3-hydroxymyristoyl)glucosamine N-acyltransferase [Acidobacteriota bacterium]
MKLSELARLTSAELVRGDAELEISSATGLTAAGPNDITFLSDTKYLQDALVAKAGAIFVSAAFEFDRDDIAVLRTANAALAYARAQTVLDPLPPVSGEVHPSAVIDPSAVVAKDVEIHAHVVIGKGSTIASGVRLLPNVTIYDNVSIGEGTTIHSGVSIRENSVIGSNCIIHNNSTIGADGFGYTKDEHKRWFKIRQTGRVVIENDVEIGANTTIDRASTGETRIARGVKIDNLVQIGHSCTVDEDALLCGHVGLAGSTKVGKRVILAGQVGLGGHLTIGDDVVITAQSGLSHDVAPGKVVSGSPAYDHHDWLRAITTFRRLPDIAKRVKEIEKRLTGRK